MRRNLLSIIVAVFTLTLLLASNVFAQQKDRAQIIKEIDALKLQIKQMEAEILSPSKETQNAYAEFLKQPDTGLIRLLPREKYDGKLSIRGGGSYYSFMRETHEYGYETNIGLEQKNFKSMFYGASIGFILNLGDVPLDDVKTETKGVTYLAEFIAPLNEPDARAQQRRAGGFEEGGFTYKESLPAKVGNTYVVRSVDYDRSDCLVAFRVVDEDADGSMTIVWKILKTFPKPVLARAER